MPDIILNTNAFRVLLDSEILNKIATRRDHVYVAKCAWEKEARAVYSTLIQTLYSAERKLDFRFHEKNVCPSILPSRLIREMRQNGASDCDVKIANLAYNRRRESGGTVSLITNDPHFHLSLIKFETLGIKVKNRDEFIADCNSAE